MIPAIDARRVVGVTAILAVTMPSRPPHGAVNPAATLPPSHIDDGILAVDARRPVDRGAPTFADGVASRW
jgi:hypothetical protein